MNTYYTIDERYLQAVDKLSYGKTPKSLKLLNEILADEPLHVRAHYQLGKIYYYDLMDYQSAGYHFKLCTELEPAFPDAYFDYICLLVFLNMEEQVAKVGAKALTVPGIHKSAIYNLLGLCCENNRKWNQAAEYYYQALMQATNKRKHDEMEENLERVKFKIGKSKLYTYNLSE